MKKYQLIREEGYESAGLVVGEVYGGSHPVRIFGEFTVSVGALAKAYPNDWREWTQIDQEYLDRVVAVEKRMAEIESRMNNLLVNFDREFYD